MQWDWIEQTKKWMTPLKRQIIFMCAVSAQLNFDLASLPVCEALSKTVPEFPFVLFVFGVFYGQMSLLAVYLVWGTERSNLRWLKSGFLLLMTWFSFAVGIQIAGGGGDFGSLEPIFLNMILTSFISLAATHWIIRDLCENRFEVTVEPQQPAFDSNLESRIVHVLMWAFASGITIVVLLSKPTQELLEHGRAFFDRYVWLWMIFWTTLCLPVSIPVLWASLSELSWARRVIVICVYPTIVSGLAWGFLRSFDNHEIIGMLPIGLYSGVVCTIVGWSLLLRLCGYRLRLCSNSADSPS